MKMLAKMYTMFVSNDCTMVEINPLVKTGDDEIVALDSKVFLTRTQNLTQRLGRYA